MKKPDAGATGCFVVIQKHFVNCGFPAFAKKHRPSRAVILIITYGPPAELKIGTNPDEFPCSVAAFVVNSEPTPGHVPRSFCVWGQSFIAVFINIVALRGLEEAPQSKKT